MNSILLVVTGLLLLTAELLSAAPATYFDEQQDALLDPELDFAGTNLDLMAKRSSHLKQKQCILQCLVCSDNTSMKMMDCTNGCSSRANPNQMRAYNACNKYLHSGRK